VLANVAEAIEVEPKAIFVSPDVVDLKQIGVYSGDDFDEYHLQKYVGGSWRTIYISTSAIEFYRDTDVSPNQEYFYRIVVRLINGTEIAGGYIVVNTSITNGTTLQPVTWGNGYTYRVNKVVVKSNLNIESCTVHGSSNYDYEIIVESGNQVYASGATFEDVRIYSAGTFSGSGTFRNVGLTSAGELILQSTTIENSQISVSSSSS